MYVSLRALWSWFFPFQEVKSHQPKRAPSSLPENTLHSPLKEKTTYVTAVILTDTGSHWNRTIKVNKALSGFFKTVLVIFWLNKWSEIWVTLQTCEQLPCLSLPRQASYLWRLYKMLMMIYDAFTLVFGKCFGFKHIRNVLVTSPQVLWFVCSIFGLLSIADLRGQELSIP